MANVLKHNPNTDEGNQVSLYYVERILELIDAECFQLAKRLFATYKDHFAVLLKTEHYSHLQQRVNCRDDWSPLKEKQWMERLQNARIFGEHKIVHDLAQEILLHHENEPLNGQSPSTYDELTTILACNNAFYLEPDDVAINSFIDANVAFIVEQRHAKNSGQKALEGNPGFNLIDTLGRRYRCFIKQVSDVRIGDRLRLKITNIPGLMLSDHKKSEQILYFEPRVTPGDLIEVELSNLSYTGNSFTFRHHSYDGFLWFKRKGVNKEIFNRNTLREKDRIIAKVLYTTEEEKRGNNGNIARLGIIKAIPLRRADSEFDLREGQDTDVARALS